jgi:hypothetical protein
MKTTDQFLEEAIDTYRQRNKVYNNNYELVGKIMMGLFPDGLVVNTAHDWERLHIFLLQVVKQTRYARNWDNGGHSESMTDLTVYAALLSEIDAKENKNE